MRLSRLLALSAFVALPALFASPASAFITPIDSLHITDVKGRPVLAYPTPRKVTIRGVVTGPDNVLSPTVTDVTIQDATGGVSFFVNTNRGTSGYNFALNDSVEVSGYLKNFSGLSEVDSTLANTSVI